MAGLSRDELLVLARVGAAARIAALEAEIALIRRTFPNLGGSAQAARRGPGRPAGTTPKPRRRKMSAAGRKRISDMMKKRWAERRKAKGRQ
jgi:hypothetical protein